MSFLSYLLVITLLCYPSMVVSLNPNCALIVPANPLSATGLSTPFYLTALNAGDGACHQYNADQASFVQGAIFDLDTNTISVYNPLVIDSGTTPATAPVVPKLPNNYVAALWFGTNADTLTLKNAANAPSLEQGQCVNGGGNTYSIFGQFSHCNAPAFFSAVNNALAKGKLTVPPLGKAKDGQPCPTTRDYSIVDQDQSDNVITLQLQFHDSATTIIVQDTVANRKKYPNAVPVGNGSDNRLLVDFVLPAIGCKPWAVTDLADPNGTPKSSLPLNEIQASMLQQWPVARIPAGDPMVLDGNGNKDINKLNAYRQAVNMFTVNSVNEISADTRTYCKHMLQTGAGRILLDQQFTKVFASPAPADAANLFDFLVMRFDNSLTELNCLNLLGLTSTPLAITVNATSDTQPLDLTINEQLLADINAIPQDPEDVMQPDFVFDSASTSLLAGQAFVSTIIVSIYTSVLLMLRL